MKVYQWRRFVRNTYAGLGLWMLLFGVEFCFAQTPGQVTGQVQLPDGEMKKGLRVRAIAKSPGAKSRTRELRNTDFNYTTRLYTYTIDRLRPGKYEFVVCDKLDYLPAIQVKTVTEGPKTTTVDFFLEDQPKGNEKITLPIKRPDGRLAQKDLPVFLNQVSTGCSVAQTATDESGTAEFGNLPKADYEVSLEEADHDP